MKKLLLLIGVCAIAPIVSLEKSYGVELTQQQDPYYIMSVAFVGRPKEDVIKPLMEAVMKRYQLSINRDNLLKCASALVSLRKESTIGVTEMQILKHMYQKGVSKTTFPKQAALSASILELTK